MQEVRIITFCDYPGCAESSRGEFPTGQVVRPMDFLVHTPRKGGRRTQPIRVEMCEAHTNTLKNLFNELLPHAQKRTGRPPNDVVQA